MILDYMHACWLEAILMVKKLGKTPIFPSREQFSVYSEIKDRLEKLITYAQRDPFLKDDFFARIVHDYARPDVASLWEDLLRSSDTLRTQRVPSLWDQNGHWIELPDFRQKEIRLDEVTSVLRGWQPSFDNPEELLAKFRDVQRQSEGEPIRLGGDLRGGHDKWLFKGFLYQVDGPYSEDELKLLILEEFDKERKRFERLRMKFASGQQQDAAQSRPRIPEQVRIEVWRRDGGKCARCDSRENLEYDHIVPISRGGSNTARNIELLCETCNRSKGAKIE